MFTITRHFLKAINIGSGIALTASRLIRGCAQTVSDLASRLWAHHQGLLVDRPSYGPQLAALVTIVLALIAVPAWVARLVAGLLDLWLSSYDRHSAHRIHSSDWDLDENGSWT
jgi:hypothetical protein